MLVTDTPFSRSLATTFIEIIGHPTTPELQVPITTAAAPVIGTTETLPSFVASSELPRIVTETVVAPLPTMTATEPQGQAIASTSTSQLVDPVIETAEQTQTFPLPASESEGQPPIARAGQSVLSLESDDDATQF